MSLKPATGTRVTARVALMHLHALAGDEIDDDRLGRLIDAATQPMPDAAQRTELGDRLRTSFMLATIALDIVDVFEAMAATEKSLGDIEAAWSARLCHPSSGS
jgi:hypothetical protein